MDHLNHFVTLKQVLLSSVVRGLKVEFSIMPICGWSDYDIMVQLNNYVKPAIVMKMFTNVYQSDFIFSCNQLPLNVVQCSCPEALELIEHIGMIFAEYAFDSILIPITLLHYINCKNFCHSILWSCQCYEGLTVNSILCLITSHIS